MPEALVIGEDRIYWEKIIGFLNTYGYDVILVNDPKNFTEALKDKNLKDKKTDIIFIDSNKMLTEGDKKELSSEIRAIKELRKEGNKTPVIFITHKNNTIATTVYMKNAGLHHVEGDLHIIEDSKLQKEMLNKNFMERLKISNPHIGIGKSERQR